MQSLKLKTLALILLLTLCGTSYAEISKITVNKAWKRLTKADNFSRIPINFENDKTPNAWVKFDEAGNYTVHVTKGLMRILDNEDEIAGILGHELGHIRLGHYESNSSAGAVRTVIGINSEIYSMNNPTGENSFGNTTIKELKFSIRSEKILHISLKIKSLKSGRTLSVNTSVFMPACEKTEGIPYE